MRRLMWCYFLFVFVYRAPLLNAQPVTCAANDGKGIAACVERAYPDKTVAGVSALQRKASMEFLRDRIIETARCKMLDVALNLKRGGPTISSDFVVWRRLGQPDTGVDIGAAYDDTSKPLRLMWHTYGPEDNYGYPYYKSYGPVSCLTPEPGPDPEPPPPAADLGPVYERIAQVEAELRQQVNEAYVKLAAQEAQMFIIHEQLQARILELTNELAILRNRYNNTTCKALFGCHVVKPE